MTELTLSQIKFKLEDLLMSKLGLSAGTYLDLINTSKDKLILNKNIYTVAQLLESKGKGAVGKELIVLWTALRKQLPE